MYDLIVIGAGPGGYEAAAHAGRMGKTVAVVEKGHLGGTCLNRGCIPTKTLLRSSKLLAECKHAERYGVRLTAPSIDFPALQRRKDSIVGTLRRGVDTLLKRSGVDLIEGHATLVSNKAVSAEGKIHEAANILVATGSKPAVPPIPGIEGDSVLDSTSILELSEIPKRLVIVGGGYIGLEFAGFFSEVGSEVIVIEMLEQLASGCDGDVSKRLLQAVRKSGVEVHLSSKVTGIDDGTVSYVDKDGAAASVSAEVILNATGRAPVTCGLGLDDIGLDYSHKGIKTSEHGKTNVPGIWACGDVTGRRLLAHAATREGIVAVNNMFGGRDRIRYEAVPTVIYTHPEVASVGPTEEELRQQGIEYKKSMVPMAIAGRFLIEHAGASGFVKALVGAEYGNILGVHAVGEGSSEFIMGAAAMIEMEMRVADVKEIVFPHPTVSEALKEAVVQAS
ncbi:MAG: dihydrolipoyl dehydrogenase [bacterium]|nr:dihydrolipoyl dehydrogenase [bacterium]